MTVLVDSWSWIEYFEGSVPGERVREVIEDSQGSIIVSVINIAEVFNAFLRDYPYPKNERFAVASRAAIKQRSQVFDIDEEIAVESARIKHKMKWGLGDSIMYATAKREGAKILTGDPHFKGLKDVIYLGN
jgi:predicted nucleic acid-binding protein